MIRALYVMLVPVAALAALMCLWARGRPWARRAGMRRFYLAMFAFFAASVVADAWIALRI